MNEIEVGVCKDLFGEWEFIITHAEDDTKIGRRLHPFELVGYTILQAKPSPGGVELRLRKSI